MCSYCAAKASIEGSNAEKRTQKFGRSPRRGTSAMIYARGQGLVRSTSPREKNIRRATLVKTGRTHGTGRGEPGRMNTSEKLRQKQTGKRNAARASRHFGARSPSAPGAEARGIR